MRIHALKQQRKIVAPRRLRKGGKRNGVRKRVHSKRTFVQRHQVIAVISALGSIAGEHAGALAGLRLGTQTLLEMAVDRVAKCAGGIVVISADEGVDAARKILGERAVVIGAQSFNLSTILAGIETSEAPAVLLHDLAFPFAGPTLMTKVALGALEQGAAVSVGPPIMNVGEVIDELVLPAIGGTQLQSVAMPQAFLREALRELSRKSGTGNTPAEHLWKALQAEGEIVLAVPNPRFNIRIGTSLDWLTARKVIWPWLQSRNKPAQEGSNTPRRV